ncbi:MAG: YcgN family cysteine cluster protein [Hyphomicrobiales bacterium]|uniref:YcgN family cysteine cluster protein n=1 Tax=Rhabdaerophilum calidifontis TaxID=2604328 RepID=UPI00123A2AD3|nr:YcgN family cysteine cluster protein [Rhabdaerophilum calidifontis]MCA1952864.1 YcgN family cysteine cluster protein [Hyphomicrobiales bacterium]MCA1998981.1 YcgN family cysteine cluster protein [Hyphomicrobiales bacterium]
MPADAPPFWKTKPLAAMNAAEWESLCDGCGRCCLIKMEDEDSGQFYFTDVACRLFDAGTCRCRDYENRDALVPDCVRLTPENAGALGWMPPSCAYRLLAEGRDLPAWHPLVSGRAESVEEAGASVRGRVSGLEDAFTLPELVARIRQWPGRWPRRRRNPRD